MMKKLLLCAVILPLCACAPKVQSTKNVDADGNQLIVEEMLGTNGSKSIHVRKNTITWVGKYAGGEEAVAERKDLMKSLSEKQADKKCAPSKSIAKGEIDYNMLDRDPMVHGGGILGYAIAAAESDYKNLPMSSWYHYYCEGEQPPKAAAPANQRNK